MSAIVHSNWISRAVLQTSFCTDASHIVQPNSSVAIGDLVGVDPVCTVGGVAQLTADHSGIDHPEVVITNCAPLVVVAELHTTSVLVRSIYKPHISLDAYCLYIHIYIYIYSYIYILKMMTVLLYLTHQWEEDTKLQHLPSDHNCDFQTRHWYTGKEHSQFHCIELYPARSLLDHF